jgi:hypothetical protein
MTHRWKHRPTPSTWGDWGPDDQLGRLNLIGPQQVLNGIAEVKTGRTFCLSLPLDYPGGNVLNQVRKAPELRPVIRNGQAYYNYRWNQVNPELNDLGCDDSVLLYTQYSTQWDSLAHRGSMFDVDGNGRPQPVYYNGFRADEHITMNDDGTVAARALGIRTWPCTACRAEGYWSICSAISEKHRAKKSATTI